MWSRRCRGPNGGLGRGCRDDCTCFPPRAARRIGRVLAAITTLLVYQLVGEVLVQFFGLPVPGPVVGLLGIGASAHFF